MNNVTRDVLYQLYETEKRPMKEISSMLGISVGTVHKYIRTYGIVARSQFYHDPERRKKSPEERLRISKMHKGKSLSKETRHKMSHAKLGKYTNPSIYGGHKKIRSDGYVSVYIPTHPYASKSGYVMEHILVMENRINKYVTRDFVVHHINGNRRDNRIENLKLMTFKQHSALHMKQRHYDRRNAI